MLKFIKIIFSSTHNSRPDPLPFFQRRVRLKNANALDLTPIRVMAEEIGENNLVLILMPRFTSRFVKKYIVPNLKTPYVKIKLDVLGSAAWLAIDGQKKVGAIADELVQKFNTETDIIDRLTKFFSFLYEQRMITFQEILSSKSLRLMNSHSNSARQLNDAIDVGLQ